MNDNILLVGREFEGKRSNEMMGMINDRLLDKLLRLNGNMAHEKFIIILLIASVLIEDIQITS